MSALQRAVGNAATARLLAPPRLDRACCTGCAAGSGCSGHRDDDGLDFERQARSAMRTTVLARQALTPFSRNPTDDPATDEEHQTRDELPAGGVPDADASSDGGTDPSCSVTAGPSYDVTGSVPVTVRPDGRKKAQFNFTAGFGASAAGAMPSCCEVHQFIKWDQRYHDQRGGPPHRGFPSSARPNQWIEDRDTADKRYGHRTDSFSDPIANCGDEYTTGGQRDQGNGNRYCGQDNPFVPANTVGTWQFQLTAVDTCRNESKAFSPVISVNWG